MGKPKCTKELIKEAVKLKNTGASNKDIAAYVGIHQSTFYRWINTPKTDAQRELSEQLKKAEPMFKAALRSKIMNAAEHGSWQAAAWMLERLYPEEYGRKDRTDNHSDVQALPRVVDDL